MTRARDELSAERRRLPMVEITKDYRFEGPQGEVGLLDLFEGRLQLIVGHFMFHPEWEDGCPSCSAGADEVADGLREHLAVRDTTLAYVSRAPLEQIERYKAKKGWTFPWYSSHGSDFNYDFDVTLDSGEADGVQLPRRARAVGGLRAAVRHAGHELLPARRRPGLPHLLVLRPRGGVDRAAPTRSSTSRRSAARRTGRSPRAAPSSPAPTGPTSRSQGRGRRAAPKPRRRWWCRASASTFNGARGEPPMSYLAGWRIALAADLLLEPGATIGSVAAQVGYGSPYALSTPSSACGVSPREHRAAALLEAAGAAA